MKWTKPEYSKEQVKKAGRNVASADQRSQEFRNAGPIFFNWRSAHAFPMQTMLVLLRNTALKVDKKAIVVQRLKRSLSILVKLIRENNMSLSRMEDIAGCRAVVDSIDDVTRVCKALKKSRTKNILFRERDYVLEPKESGYRGVHLIYKYNCGKKEYRGMAVELQIRSKIQHSWATAVEVVSTFTKQALKASTGDQEWLDFFRYASVEFSRLEGCPVDSRYKDVDTFSLMAKLVKGLGIIDRLKAFGFATKILTRGKGQWAYYYMLLLDPERGTINVTYYGKSQLSQATERYDALEEQHKGDPSIDVVLVSAASVRELKKAYPNYFADTDDFQRYLIKVNEANTSLE